MNIHFQMQKFGIILYLVLNLTLNLALIKFNIENRIRLENNFFTQILNFDIDTSI